MRLLTGCIAGALDAADYEAKLLAAGFESVSIEPTRIFERDDILSMATDMAIVFPGDFDADAVLDELSGAVMSAFVRARRPEPVA